ncbi:TolC family protein, partial [Bacteroides heparinolyticus]
MIKTYIKSIVYCAILLGAFGLPLSVLAQQEMSREERIKILQKLNMEDRKLEAVTTELATQNIPENLDELQIPPLSVFLDAVVENATVKKARSRVEQSKNEYLLQKRDWMNYFRINGAYGYGRYNIIGNASNEFTPMYQTSMSSAQHTFNIGASVNIPIG